MSINLSKQIFSDIKPMFIYLSLPILIINIIVSGIAIYDITKYYHFTTFKPRLIMVAVIILANIPISIVFIFPDMIKNGFLKNNFLCYCYLAFSATYLVKSLAIITLSALVGFIMLSNFSVNRLNLIGWHLNWVLVGFLVLLEAAILPISGARGIDYAIEDVKQDHPKRCVAKSELVYHGSGYLTTMSSFISLGVAIVCIVANLITNKFKKGTSSNRLAYSFLFFSIANISAILEWVISLITGKAIKGNAKWAILDLSKLAPALFAATYLLSEAYGRIKNIDFGIKKVLQIKKCRNLYREYCSNIGARVAYELVTKWENVTVGDSQTIDVLDRKNLSRQEAIAYIEKHLELELYDFLISEAFNDFYVIYNKGGQIEANLTERLEQK